MAVRGDGLLFSRGQQHVHLPFTRQERDVLGQLDEAVGDAAHGGDHHHDLVALGMVLGHAGGHIFDAVGVAYRGAAVFLNNQCHTKLWKLPEQCLAPRNRTASLNREQAIEKAELEVRAGPGHGSQISGSPLTLANWPFFLKVSGHFYII